MMISLSLWTYRQRNNKNDARHHVNLFFLIHFFRKAHDDRLNLLFWYVHEKSSEKPRRKSRDPLESQYLWALRFSMSNLPINPKNIQKHKLSPPQAWFCYLTAVAIQLLRGAMKECLFHERMFMLICEKNHFFIPHSQILLAVLCLKGQKL